MALLLVQVPGFGVDPHDGLALLGEFAGFVEDGFELGALSVGDASVVEGNAGTTPATITLTFSHVQR